jgi:hypothetical protein
LTEEQANTLYIVTIIGPDTRVYVDGQKALLEVIEELDWSQVIRVIVELSKEARIKQ